MITSFLIFVFFLVSNQSEGLQLSEDRLVHLDLEIPIDSCTFWKTLLIGPSVKFLLGLTNILPTGSLASIIVDTNHYMSQFQDIIGPPNLWDFLLAMNTFHANDRILLEDFF